MLEDIELVRAIAQERLVAYAQPIVYIPTETVTRYELLVRLLDPAGHLVAPDQFLEAAERLGMVVVIDRWMTRAGLERARDGIAVSINLSAGSIGDPEILALIRTALGDGVSAELLMFEVTETAALTDLDLAVGFVRELRQLGCHVALDDFGTGFGAFTYLARIPANCLKIDRSFVTNLSRDEVSREVVKAIVALARGLEKLTIAEGVEDAEALALLRCYGVDHVQGFYYGRPAPLLTPTRSQPAPGVPGTLRSGARRPRPRVLVAEDNQVNQLAAVRLLERCGYAADLVQTGTRAIEEGLSGRYAAVILDCQLPERRGDEVARAIRAAQGGEPRMPIIAMSADTSEINRERCVAAGMDEFLAKPLTAESLKRALLRCAPWPAAQTSGADHSALVDRGVLVASAGSVPQLTEDLILLFGAESRRELAELTAAVAEGNMETTAEIAGRLRGGCADVGATAMAEACERLAASAGRDTLGAVGIQATELVETFELSVAALDGPRRQQLGAT